MKVYRAIDGTLTPLETDAASHDEVTAQTGHGMYATFRTYGGDHAFRLGYQFERMRTSADLLGQAMPHTINYLRAVSRKAITAAGYGEARLRVTSLHDAPETVIISVEPFTPPPEAYRTAGVAVGLAAYARKDARAKDSRWVDDRAGLWEGQGDVYEVMLYDDERRVLEGLSSNFYAIMGGTLYTADEGVLAGVARSIVLELAPDVLPVEMHPIQVGQLPHLEGAFLTSSSRGVIPIKRIAEQAIPLGDAVFKLQRAYDAHLEAELEPI